MNTKRQSTFTPATASRLAMHVMPGRYCASCSGTFRPAPDSQSTACPSCGSETILQSEIKTAPVKVVPTRVPLALIDKTITRLLDREQRLPQEQAGLKQKLANLRTQRTAIISNIAALRLQQEAGVARQADVELADRERTALDREIAEAADDVAAADQLGRVIAEQIHGIVDAKRDAMQAEVIGKARAYFAKLTPLLLQIRALTHQAHEDAQKYEPIFSDGALLNGSPRFDPTFHDVSIAIGALGTLASPEATTFWREVDRLRQLVARLT